MPPTTKKHKIPTKILTNEMFKNMSKVAIHGRFDLKIGIGLKNNGDPYWKSSKSSHGDYFHDQKM